jgi:acylaminoacyl-peptidase
MISDPQLSPDSTKLSFITTRCNDDEYETIIWVVDSNNGYPIRFYSGGNPLNPRWSPNGQQILFTSRRGMKLEEKGTGIWVTQVWGGEPRQICKIRGEISNPQWNKYGTKVYFVTSVGENKDGDVKIIDKIPFWFNDEGWTYFKTKQLHVVDVNSGIMTLLTQGEENIQCFAAGNQGGKVAYAKSANLLKPSESELYVYDIAKGKHEKIVSGYMISDICWSQNDEQIAFLGHNGRHGDLTHLGIHLVSPKDGKVNHLTDELDLGCERSNYYDIRSPYACIPSLIWEGQEIYFPVSESDRVGIYRIHVEHGHIDPVINGQFSVEEFTISKYKVAYTRINATKPTEIWVKEDETEGCITRFNDHLIANISLSELSQFDFKQKDKCLVEGWVLKPYRWRKSEKFPAILDIHGGPKSKFGDSFMFEHQLYVANGYGVIIINIRGSDGYSQKFADIRGEWGIWNYEDLKMGVKTALKQNPWIDKDRLGITGFGYGGFITNWVITHSDMFKSAISQNSISNWSSFFSTSDIGFHFTTEQIGGSPWSNKDKYIEKSPITYAEDVQTPVLFIHSWNDYRCWIDQSIEFFTALKYLGKETKLAIFMEGPHGFSNSGKPSLRKKRLEIMIDWFNKYLRN